MDDQTPQDPVTPFTGTALVERPRPAVVRPAVVQPTELERDEGESSKTPPIPERVGRYKILSKLAQGGMARVFIAQRDGAEGICVFKQLLADLERNETAARRFRREAHVASYLQHENIARVIDAGDEAGVFYMAMEFIEGKDIEAMSHELLATRRLLPYPITLTALCGILRGLEYAHRATDPAGEWMQVVHRDLSPRNMMLTFAGESKVIDFGMAKLKTDSFKTSPGMVLGTLRFVSPEQATAEPVDLRGDLYSVAVVLFELLTGHMLVKPGSGFEMMRAVAHDVPPLVGSLNETLPRALDAVVARGLAKSPADRFQSATEFIEALNAAAPDWCHTPGALIGEFMREQFPADVEATRAHLARGGASSATLGGSEAGKTRTVMAQDLAAPAPPSDADGEEWVRPQTMVTGEVALTTRTGLVFPELTRTAAGIPTVLLRSPDLLDTAEDDPSLPTLRDSLLPQPPTAQFSLPPTQFAQTPAPARDRWAELRGALIATAIFAAVFVAWQLLRAPDRVELPLERPTPAALAPGAVRASPEVTATPAEHPRSASPVRRSPTASPVDVARRSAGAAALPSPTPRASATAPPGKSQARRLRDRLAADDPLQPIIDEARRLAQGAAGSATILGLINRAESTGNRETLDKALSELE